MPALEPAVAAPVPRRRVGGLIVLRILIDPVACDAYGYCAELLPESISLDEWGYPIVDGKPLPPELAAAARRGGAGLSPARHHPAGAQERSLRVPDGGTMARMSVERALTSVGLVVRPAGVADLARVVELLRLGPVPGGPPSTEEPEDLAPYRTALSEIDASGGVVLVAELSGDVVGTCQLIVFRHFQARGGRCAEIESVHVHPDHRGSGVGRALLLHAIERARGLGCYRVQLTSNVDRPDAHRFYERLGLSPSHVGFKMLLPEGSASRLPMEM